MDKDIAGSNSDSESISYTERDGKWIIDNENIFKEGLKKPVAGNSFNNGGKKVDIQTTEAGNICYSRLTHTTREGKVSCLTGFLLGTQGFCSESQCT